MKNKAAQALGRLGGKAKSEAKTETARKNGAKGGRPGMYSVSQNGQTLQHSISCTFARNIATQLVAAGKTGIYVEFFRKADGQRGFFNQDGHHAISGEEWTA